MRQLAFFLALLFLCHPAMAQSSAPAADELAAPGDEAVMGEDAPDTAAEPTEAEEPTPEPAPEPIDAQPEPADEATAAATTDAASAAPASPAPEEPAAPRALEFCSGQLCLRPGVRLRLRYDVIEDDTDAVFVGRNDGFGLSSGRAKLAGAYGDWVGFKLSVEGGLVHQTDTNLVAGTTFAALKDAYFDFTPFSFLMLRAGQFKLPFDEESLRSTAALRFVDRSVGSRGLRAGEGYQVEPLAPPRDLGVMIGADGLALGPVDLTYLLSLTNGNGLNQAYNDNSYPAVHGRVAAAWSDMVSVGLGGLFNPRTVGALPNLYDEIDTGLSLDAQAALWGAFLEASYGLIWTQYPTTGAPDSFAMAATAELGYVLWFGLGAAYRFSWYDPTSTFDNDAIFEHSVGLRYDVPEQPLALILEYTMALEQQGRELQNNRLGAVLQLDI